MIKRRVDRRKMEEGGRVVDEDEYFNNVQKNKPSRDHKRMRKRKRRKRKIIRTRPGVRSSKEHDGNDHRIWEDQENKDDKTPKVKKRKIGTKITPLQKLLLGDDAVDGSKNHSPDTSNINKAKPIRELIMEMSLREDKVKGLEEKIKKKKMIDMSKKKKKKKKLGGNQILARQLIPPPKNIYDVKWREWQKIFKKTVKLVKILERPSKITIYVTLGDNTRKTVIGKGRGEQELAKRYREGGIKLVETFEAPSRTEERIFLVGNKPGGLRLSGGNPKNNQILPKKTTVKSQKEIEFENNVLDYLPEVVKEVFGGEKNEVYLHDLAELAWNMIVPFTDVENSGKVLKVGLKCLTLTREELSVLADYYTGKRIVEFKPVEYRKLVKAKRVMIEDPNSFSRMEFVKRFRPNKLSKKWPLIIRSFISNVKQFLDCDLNKPVFDTNWMLPKLMIEEIGKYELLTKCPLDIEKILFDFLKRKEKGKVMVLKKREKKVIANKVKCEYLLRAMEVLSRILLKIHRNRRFLEYVRDYTKNIDGKEDRVFNGFSSRIVDRIPFYSSGKKNLLTRFKVTFSISNFQDLTSDEIKKHKGVLDSGTKYVKMKPAEEYVLFNRWCYAKYSNCDDELTTMKVFGEYSKYINSLNVVVNGKKLVTLFGISDGRKVLMREKIIGGEIKTNMEYLRIEPRGSTKLIFVNKGNGVKVQRYYELE